MKRKTWWVMLTIMSLVAPMLIVPTSHSDSVKKNISLKRERAKRTGQTNASGKLPKGVDLTPTRRTKAELERIAKKREDLREKEAKESPLDEKWLREAPPKGILSLRQKQMSPMGALAAGLAPKLSKREDWAGKVNLRNLRPVNRRALESLPTTLSPSVIGTPDIIVVPRVCAVLS